MKVVWSACDKELRVEMKSANEKLTTPKIHFKTSKGHSFLEKLM